jgi:CheY-like chemotaxis protein
MGQRILFVVDQADFREVFTHAREEALAPEEIDIEFVETGTAAEARERFLEGGLDGVLIDVTLPDGYGLDLVRKIKSGSTTSHVPVLVLAAELQTSVAGRAMEAGATGVFSKPAAMPETVEAIKRLTDAWRSGPKERTICT